MSRRGLWVLALCVSGAASGAEAPGDRDALADLEAQADYAFYTTDAARAARIVADAAGLASAAPTAARYQYAHAAFRWLQLASAGHDSDGVERAGRACQGTLEPIVEADPRAAEARALLAACAGYVALGGGLRGRALALRIDAWLEAAAAVAPANPRVRLTRGMLLWFRAAPPPDRVARARIDFEAAATTLEAPHPSVDGEPGWGAADAWLFAGHAAQAAGDAAAARSAYERALLSAPEFAAARRALDALTARR
jgi:hypothetical protein